MAETLFVSCGIAPRTGRQPVRTRAKCRAASRDQPSEAVPGDSKVRRVLEGIDGGKPWKGLNAADAAWTRLKEAGSMDPFFKGEVVHRIRGRKTPAQVNGDTLNVDVLICGGTLGIFLALALLKQNEKKLRVAVVERGPLVGREQEWNISREELGVLVDTLGLFSADELEECVRGEFNPMRIAFGASMAEAQAAQLEVRNVLNLGVAPDRLIAKSKAKFEALGGVLLEFHEFVKTDLYDHGSVTLLKKLGRRKDVRSQGAGGASQFESVEKGAAGDGFCTVNARLVVDAMGNFSPIMLQARRQNGRGLAPDGVCLVVGTCADNAGPWDVRVDGSGDLIYSITPVANQRQYFWEAFPAAGGGRTTYMFSYLDAEAGRPSLIEMFEDYFDMMPAYQYTTLDALEFRRALFGFFPSYKDSPLSSSFDRILHVGDSSGLQSPLSFGGFGALLRHLDRLCSGISIALEEPSDRLLKASALQALTPYQPSLSVTWLFQRSMCVKLDQDVRNENLVNQVLQTTFLEMSKMGTGVLVPFLQDVVQAGGLTRALVAMTVADLGLVLQVMAVVGPGGIASWYAHYMALLSYAVLSRLAEPLQGKLLESPELSPVQKYFLLNTIRAWQYGSGRDHGATRHE
ncbi:hypothetical protein FVE85_9467 [Porphyridium purpureum]|uniref:Uncharacterized protein n=1 Tax=Porphyridium purpureum TaxID=35688 RepID=A0A5J4YJD9_PORPP|nr:hypothetical protein FVE85_9467 [Porphyridium purpureum]|eukprot:POR5693..scf261_15